MLYQVLNFFNIQPDITIGGMKKNQTLFHVTTSVLADLEHLFENYIPDYVVVQGDTTSAFVGALAAYYKQIKIIHIEAGLRSNNLYSPFPEEGNRILTGHLADIHFTPTAKATENLKSEGITKNVFRVGNTVIDALLITHKIVTENLAQYASKFKEIDLKKKIILITGHRRESFGYPFEQICEAISVLSEIHPDYNFVYPVHLNPNVREYVFRILKGKANVLLSEPLDYPTMVWLLNEAFIILTDSGGIQEEAPTFGKPVLVMRDVTERIEGVESGTAKLVGTDKDKIIESVEFLINNEAEYTKMAQATNPYGDGTACNQIIDILNKI